jgi:hypothetical protein
MRIIPTITRSSLLLSFCGLLSQSKAFQLPSLSIVHRQLASSSSSCSASFLIKRSLSSKMSSENVWNPPAKIEDLFSKTAGNQFAAINSPVAGARTQQDLPVGNAPLQLYSLATPNGMSFCV